MPSLPESPFYQAPLQYAVGNKQRSPPLVGQVRRRCFHNANQGKIKFGKQKAPGFWIRSMLTKFQEGLQHLRHQNEALIRIRQGKMPCV
jgi:hypothetical protein